MTFIELLLLSLVQGVGEFLPISSSAHLNKAYSMMHEGSLPFSIGVVLQLASVVGMLLYLKDSIKDALTGLMAFFKSRDVQATLADERILPWLQAGIANLPVIAIGLLFKDNIEEVFSDPSWVYVLLGITGCALLISNFRHHKKHTEYVDVQSLVIPWTTVAIVGIAQVATLLPGISRFGSTTAALLLLGLPMAHAIRFSFHMGAIVLLLAGAKEALELLMNLQDVNVAELGIAFGLTAIISAVFGPMLLRFFERKGLWIPAVYLLCVPIIGHLI